MKRCVRCQGEEFNTSYEDRPVSPKLHEVILVGVRKDTCSHCHESYIEIPCHALMTEAVTTAILNKKGLLAPAEIRWLRSCLGLTGEEFAKHLGVSRTVVSYWENGKRDQDPSSDRLLRLAVVGTLPVGSFSLSVFTQIEGESREPLAIQLRFEETKAWMLVDDYEDQFVQTPTKDPIHPGWQGWLQTFEHDASRPSEAEEPSTL